MEAIVYIISLTFLVYLTGFSSSCPLNMVVSKESFPPTPSLYVWKRILPWLQLSNILSSVFCVLDLNTSCPFDSSTNWIANSVSNIEPIIILHFVSLCVLCLEICKLEPSETPLTLYKTSRWSFWACQFNIIMSLEFIPFRYVSPDGTNAMIIQTAFHASQSFLPFSLTPAFTRESRTKPN